MIPSLDVITLAAKLDKTCSGFTTEETLRSMALVIAKIMIEIDKKKEPGMEEVMEIQIEIFNGILKEYIELIPTIPKVN